MATDAPSDILLNHPAVGRPVHELPTPAALVDLDRLEANIATMANVFRDSPVKLRPHAKTHRCAAIARMQIAAGARGIICAKVSMAEAMVDGGIRDVFVSNQVVSRQAIDRLCLLAKRAKVTALVDAVQNVADLSAAAQHHGVTLAVIVEVDTGVRRCGTAPGLPTLVVAQAVAAAPGLEFAGLQAYEGHASHEKDPVLRREKCLKSLALVMESRDLLEQNGLPVKEITVAGTGTYDISGVYPGVTEVQPGSYVYMDPGYQAQMPAFQLAFSVLCTVVSRPIPERVVVDGGTQVLAADNEIPLAKGHSELVIGGLSEEHGTWYVKDGATTALRVGDVVEIHPGHCCTAANLHDRVYAVRNGIVEAVWATARGSSQ